MKIAVFTTFHKDGYERYGKRMIQSFDANWPEEVELHVYCEDVKPKEKSNRIIYKDLHKSCPDLVSFKKRHRKNPLAHGKDLNGNLRHKSFKYMAVRFSHKVYSMQHAISTIDADVVIWLDADSFTFGKIPIDFLHGLISEEILCTYIGRPGNKGDKARKWSECGFMAYNKNHTETLNFHNHLKNMYDTDDIFNWQEWHDSWLFDRVRERFEKKKDVKNRDLNVVGNKRHPFVNTILGKYIDHLKGDHRKTQGKSNKGIHDIVVNHKNDYWK